MEIVYSVHCMKEFILLSYLMATAKTANTRIARTLILIMFCGDDERIDMKKIALVRICVEKERMFFLTFLTVI